MLDPVVTIEPLAVKKTTAARMLDCGATKIYELCRSGELETILIGNEHRVVVRSIHKLVNTGGEKPKP